jgi:hypothetical protein
MQRQSREASEGKRAFRISSANGREGIYFRGLLNKKNKRRLLTQTEKKKRIKKRKRSNRGRAYAYPISEPRRMRGRERGGQGLHDAT